MYKYNCVHINIQPILLSQLTATTLWTSGPWRWPQPPALQPVWRGELQVLAPKLSKVDPMAPYCCSRHGPSPITGSPKPEPIASRHNGISIIFGHTRRYNVDVRSRSRCIRSRIMCLVLEGYERSILSFRNLALLSFQGFPTGP